MKSLIVLTDLLKDKKPKVDKTGLRCGKLLVLSCVGYYIIGNQKKVFCYLCKCDCGKECVIQYQSLMNGDTKSCGCLVKERMRKLNLSHGDCWSPTYHSWTAMKNRCHNKKHMAYKNYGGRGIKICNRWLESNGQGYANFLADMGERPSKKLTLDRINNDGDYEPSNCKWSNRSEQIKNQRKRTRNKLGQWSGNV